MGSAGTGESILSEDRGGSSDSRDKLRLDDDTAGRIEMAVFTYLGSYAVILGCQYLGTK